MLVVVGTRPEAIKLAPIIMRMNTDPRFDAFLVSTGQHPDLLGDVLPTFSLSPDIDLGLGGLMLSELTGACLSAVAAEVRERQPTAVMVQGDTSTALAGGLAGFYEGIPVVHVEAGLRSGNIRSPFPEEANRKLLSAITSIHLAPTQEARRNLLAEGIPRDRVVVTGNTVVDALRWTLSHSQPGPDFPEALNEHEGAIITVTTHRRESWGEPMRRTFGALNRLAEEHESVLFVVPLHPNPLVREVVPPTYGRRPNVMLIEPLDYRDFVHLLGRSHLVITDSGGIQEEAVSLGLQVALLRENTERPEGLESGLVQIVGTDPEQIHSTVGRMLCSVGSLPETNPYGDGRAAERSLDFIANRLEDDLRVLR